MLSAAVQPFPRTIARDRRLPQHQIAQPAQPLSPRELTSRIKHASATELLHLHTTHQQLLDEVHISAFLNRLATCSSIHSRPGHYTAEHRQRQKQQQRRLNNQKRHSGLQHDHEQQLLLALLQDVQHLIPTMRHRAAASILWALAKLRQVLLPPELLEQLLDHVHKQLGFSSFEPRQLCIMAYALLQLQARGVCGSSSSSRRKSRGQQQHVLDARLLDDLYAALGHCLHLCSAHDVAQAIYTLAQLQHVPPAGWLEAWLQRAQQVLPQCTPQGLANSAYGLATALHLAGALAEDGGSGGSSGCSGSALYGSDADRKQGSGSASSEAGSSGRSSGISSLDSLLQQQQQQQHTTVGSSDSSRCLPQMAATARHQPGQQALLAAAREWLQHCMQVAVLHLPALQPGELYGQLLWACGKLRCALPQPAERHILARAEALLPACDAQHLAAALYCYARLQLQPSSSWLDSLWRQVEWHWDSFQPIDVSQLLWAAAALQLAVPQRLEGRLRAALCRMFAAGPRVVHVGFMVSAMRSMVALGVALDRRFWIRFQGSVAAQVQMFRAPEYADVLWALAVGHKEVDVR